MNKQLRDALLSHQTIGVFSHIRPDGDAIGSQIALCIWLEGQGKTVFGFNDDPLPANIEWMKPYFPIKAPDRQNLASCDAYLFVDGNDIKRFGTEAENLYESGKPLYMMDHHPDPEPYFNVSVSVPGKSSTAELVYEFICEDDPSQITPNIAKALYAGVMTDTGSFRFNSVHPSTHRCVAHLLESGGFTPDEIHEAVYDNNELRHLRLLGAAMKNIKLFHSNQLAVMSVTQAMLDESGCQQSDTEGFVSFPLSLKQTKAAFLLYEMDGKIKVSLRSKGTLDVNQVARRFEGGGHQKAAGAWHRGPIEQAVEDIIAVAAEQLKDYH